MSEPIPNLKKLPTLHTDEEAEDFVANSDLSEYDLSGGQIVHFELRPKDKTISLRLPAKLLEAVRGKAQTAGIPYQRFIRMALEKEVGGGKA